ncbi:MAG: hypothetical protein JWR60_4095, partial [Polaromonas sp.]|nr:hypothetical protein [Polaromonas sp.]
MMGGWHAMSRLGLTDPDGPPASDPKTRHARESRGPAGLEQAAPDARLRGNDAGNERLRQVFDQVMRGLRALAPAAWLVAGLALAGGPALAHKGSDAYLDIQQLEAGAGQPGSQAAGAGEGAGAVQGAAAAAGASAGTGAGGSPVAVAGPENSRTFRLTLAVAVRDLDLVVPMDANADARVTWGEVKAATP